MHCQLLFWPKTTSKLSAFVRICKVQNLHYVDLCGYSLQRIEKPSILLTKGETNLVIPLEHMSKNIGNRSLFRPRQERLLPLFHVIDVFVLFFAAHPTPQSLPIWYSSFSKACST
ncbi:hypothetical protein AVEN_273672-1 [Araneus ventricosus]|uniref:Uncharacterized protein n=1 Tax=Araneus ventricosus TaxID=182803 RepID=A0A4Y2PNB2_ARAVE|nr:hypothetical protein AVEN_273672-1 [Araneus ventricosus]